MTVPSKLCKNNDTRECLVELRGTCQKRYLITRYLTCYGRWNIVLEALEQQLSGPLKRLLWVDSFGLPAAYANYR
jgi:hypothetical protein